jgi:hypothetical protein
MATVKEANQVRLALKMKLSNYSWYSFSGNFSGNNGYFVVIFVKYINSKIKRHIPSIVKGVTVKTELE